MKFAGAGVKDQREVRGFGGRVKMFQLLLLPIGDKLKILQSEIANWVA